MSLEEDNIMTAGRPTKYREEFVEQVYKLALLGAKDREIASFFEVCEATINIWKIEYPEFLESLKKGKIKADAEIASSMYDKAKGFFYKEEHAFKLKAGKDEEKVEVVQVERFSPPDTTAAIFWLKNRQSREWRDRQEIKITEVPLEQLKEEELDARIGAFSKETGIVAAAGGESPTEAGE